MTTATSPRIQQIEAHGVDRAKYEFASFVAGRGWSGHKTLEQARKAAARDVRRAVRNHGGGEPQNLVVTTSDGRAV